MVDPFLPPELQTPGVVVTKVTVRPDEAVALTLNGDCASRRSPSVPKPDRLAGLRDVETLTHRWRCVVCGVSALVRLERAAPGRDEGYRRSIRPARRRQPAPP